MPSLLARRSQFAPITSPVENSARAMGSGRRSEGPSPRTRRRRLPIPLVFWAAMRRLRTERRYRIGASDRVSAPAATATSAAPVAMARAQSRNACSDDTHATLTVWAGQLGDSWLPSTTSRPRFEVAGSAMTVPMTSRSTISGSILARCTRLETAIRPRS